MKNGNNIARTLMLTTAVAGVYGLLGCERKAEARHGVAHIDTATDKKILYWHDPMVPGQKFDKPGKSPYMDMQLVPVYASGEGDEGGVSISPRVQQNIGVRTEKVERRPLASAIRLDGRVTADESRIRSVTAHVIGYVEKLHASVSGQTVRQGESLLDLYSPDLVSTQEELVQALGYRDELPQGTSTDLRKEATDLVQSARHRLMNWGISESFVNVLENTRHVEQQVPIVSPVTGILIHKNVIEGQNVTQGMEMFQIADLTRVWVTAQVYQEDLATIKIGSPVALTLRNLPGRDFLGRVSFIFPEMDPVTRTVEIRIELSNTPTLDFRPEMFAEVLVHGSSDSVLAVPEPALIHSGIRNFAVVALGEGRFQPREVRTGRSAEGYTEILDGLKEGDNIVVSAEFFLDSESNLRAVVEQMSASMDSGNAGSTDMSADTSKGMGDKNVH